MNGFTGTNCQSNIDDCASNPCYNGGVCKDSLNSFTCDCPLGFSGSRCEINNNDCVNNLCLNGDCIDGIHDFTCRCNPGFAGRLCDKKIDECDVNPCQYGGTCEVLGYGGYKVCNCYDLNVLTSIVMSTFSVIVCLEPTERIATST